MARACMVLLKSQAADVDILYMTRVQKESARPVGARQ